MGLATLDALLQKGGFGIISRRSTPLASYHLELRRAFEATVRYVNPRFRFVFIEDGTINGIAYRGASRSYVGLTMGCVTMLSVLFRTCLQSSLLMKHLPGGVASKSILTDIQTAFRACVFGGDKAGVPKSYSAGLGRPEDSARAETCYRLFKRALVFLFYHELSHLGRGHGRLLQAAGGASLILEAGSANTSEYSHPAARPWSELEADWLAMVWLLFEQKWQANPRKNENILFELWFAVGVVFLIFSLAAKASGHAESCHPHPALRLAHLIDQASWFLIDGERYPFTTPASIQKAANRALEELAAISQLASFDWLTETQMQTENARDKITALRMQAGRVWVEAANRSMNKIIRRPPPTTTI
jgi:hypothetical protein